MKKFSKNAKLNTILGIYEDLRELGIEEIKRYYNEFKSESDYNIAQYGNLLIYYDDVKGFYKNAGYKILPKMSDSKLWETYRRQVGSVARILMRENVKK